MADVERGWFRRVLAAEDIGPIHYTEEDRDGVASGLRDGSARVRASRAGACTTLGSVWAPGRGTGGRDGADGAPETGGC
ncbi:hypothetical protein EAO75_25465 [Streptomyces sp. uw30]|nr:hypothetical protein EAO75_25465 [Streptomyces sp. uw30]